MNNSIDKRLLPLAVLEILQRHSDRNHRLTQETIIEYLSKDYNIHADRRTISSAISSLVDAGFDIDNFGRGAHMDSNLFEFDDTELQTLIDAVISSSYIPASTTNQLVKKLRNLSNDFFPEIPTVVSDHVGKTKNKSLFLNIEVINEAIEAGRKISFDYYRLTTKMALEHRSTPVVTPYLTLVKNQRYYLMCHRDGTKDISFLRLDLIQNIQILEGTTATPINEACDYMSQVPTAEQIATQYPYMFSGPCNTVQLRVKKNMLYTVVDWFGEAIDCHEDPDDSNYSIVFFRVNFNAIIYWCMQYSDSVEVLWPKELRTQIQNKLKDALAKYTD